MAERADRTATVDAPTASAPAGSPSSASVPLIVAALGAVVVGQGGFYGPTQWLVGAAIALATMIEVRRSQVRFERATHAPAFAAIALAGWAIIRAAADGDPKPGVLVALLIAGAVAVAALLARAPRADRAAAATLLAVLGAGVAATGWIGVAAHLRPWAMTATSTWRASSVVTYPNATAALLVLTLMPVLARQVRHGRDTTGALLVWAHVVGIGATQSRGGAIGLAVALAIIALTLGVRSLVAALAAPVLGGLVALATLAPSIPDDSSAHLLLALAGAVAGGAIAASTRAARRPAHTLAAAALGVAAAFAALSASGRLPADRIRFTAPDRAHANELARSAIADHPLFGVGPGNLRLIWDTPDALMSLRFVHNEYLQLTAELGLVGAAILAIVALALVRRLTAARRHADVAMWSASIAGLGAFAVHAAFDFLWHVPAVPLVAAAVLGLGLAPRGRRSQPRPHTSPHTTRQLHTEETS